MAQLRIEEVIRRPLITEKNTWLMEKDQYTFEVHPDANKLQIRAAVEETFSVTVKASPPEQRRATVIPRRGLPAVVRETRVRIRWKAGQEPTTAGLSRCGRCARTSGYR